MRISVVGIGKLGLPWAAVLADSGHEVMGVDLNSDVVDQVNDKQSPYQEPGLQELLDKHVPHQLAATTDTVDAVLASEVTFVLAPTPSTSDGSFSNSYVLDAIAKIARGIADKNEWHLVVISSTVMPGSTLGPILKELERGSGKSLGKDFGLCYSPEFIALGSVIHDMRNPDIVLIGASDSKSGLVLSQITGSVAESNPPHHIMSVVEAEIAKISVNAFVTMKISFANTLAEMCENVPGANATVIADAIGDDTRIGRKYLTPATAYGGPCFPRDTTAFYVAGRRLLTEAELAIATQNINLGQVDRLADLVDDMAVGLEGNSVGILGLSYKPDTPVAEQSVGSNLAAVLVGRGWDVFTYDPMVSGNVESASQCVEYSNVVVVCTAWPEFADVDFQNRKVIDCWGLAKNVERGNLYRIGVGLC